MAIERHFDEEGRRVYISDDKGLEALSVTTIIEEMETPEELNDWKERNSGEKDEANHKHLTWYKSNRGTLLHYEVLSMFEDAHDAPELFSEDEASSEEELGSDHSPDKIFSILKDKGLIENEEEMEELDNEISIEKIYEQDKEVFKKIFNTVAVKEGINQETVEGIEKMFVTEVENIPYGGQIDLIYRDKEGELVVADLKTSSAVREKHLLQAAAYAKSVDENCRAEIIRIHPDSGGFNVKKMGGEEIQEKWETFKELASKAYN